jgi:predicted metal-binding protein
MEETYRALLDRAMEMGASEAGLIHTDRIVFDPRAFLKCRFGCHRWGKFWTCPPNLLLSPELFMEGMKRYHTGMIIKTPDPKKGQEVAVAIEKEAMIKHGFGFAFALALCVQCEECAYPEPCRFPHLARPTMDAFGMDIMKTVGLLGFKTEFDPGGNLLPGWYSMVLLD